MNANPIKVFIELPLSMKIAAGVLGGGSLLILVYMILPAYFWIIFIGLVFVAAFLLGYGYYLSWQRKRRAAPMEQGLRSNSASTPHGISDPASVARIDDLNRQFEEGLEQFRASGKNIYSLPWYVLVGEPGSGKTEAIRHSTVGFPPGLQDELQGTGGTLNMNWWFTNHAVILDTAGRLMFEEIQPGVTSEWSEFLKLLRKNRPNCPINGMLLTISAESLIKDTANDLERKGSKIAQQLDNIQRVLGVRFPVFVMITKCDLINGFREFFDDLIDPNLQHQALGWSNPAPLDEPFDPADVDQHLAVVKQRLLRRRMRLLMDPVHTEAPDGRRTDQVDALFAFPEALMRLGPRLKEYLEKIFVAGTWSAKPLFLRGIYFTSAMREGSALDADLAEVLGVDVDSLPEGRVWERERSNFLKHLFVDKVFKEKGLVTRATNTLQLQRQRKGAILGTGLGSLVLLVLLTIFGHHQLKQSIGDQLATWSSIQKQFVGPAGNDKPIVTQQYPGSPYDYSGASQINLGSQSNTTLGQFPVELQVTVEEEISIPWVFQPLRWFSWIMTDSFDASRRKAMGVLFETGYFQPLFDAARSKMARATKEDWSPQATEAMAQLIQAEVMANSQPSLIGSIGGGDAPEDLDIDALFRYVLVEPKRGETVYAQYKADDASIQGAMHWIYSKRSGGQDWPPPLLASNPQATQEAVEKGAAAFMGSWMRQVEGKADNLLTYLVNLNEGLGQFIQGQEILRQLGNDLDLEIAALGMPTLIKEWQNGIDLIKKGKEKIKQAREALGDQIDQPVDQLCAQARDRVIDSSALPAYDRLIKAMDEKERTDMEDQTRIHLANVRSQLTGSREILINTAETHLAQLEQQLPKRARLLLAKVPRIQERQYEIQFKIYQHADTVYRDGVKAIQELIAQYKAFPLCLTPGLSPQLETDKLQRAIQLVDRVKGVATTPPTAPGGGLDLFRKTKEEQQSLISSAHTLVVGHHEGWFERVSAVCDALRSDTPLKCDIVVLPHKEQLTERPQWPSGLRGSSLRRGSDLYRYFEIYQGDRLITPRLQTDRVIQGEPPSIQIPGPRLTFKFYEHSDDLAVKGTELPAHAPWGVLTQLHQGDAKPEADRQAWKVAFIIPGRDGHHYFWWVNLKFNKPLPAIDQWPTQASWPKAYKH